MAAISFNSFILSLTTIFITLHLLSLHARTPDYVFDEEETRLGSTPPSCHNKCNQCHPCMARQVPTLTSHEPVTQRVRADFNHDPLADNKFSNYKPLGWKCICKDHFYNP